MEVPIFCDVCGAQLRDMGGDILVDDTGGDVCYDDVVHVTKAFDGPEDDSWIQSGLERAAGVGEPDRRHYDGGRLVDPDAR